MKERFVRTIEAIIALAATYMAGITMVQTTLYNRIIEKLSNSVIGPSIETYVPYFDVIIVISVLFLSFSFWRKGDEVWFGRISNLNMLMFFPSVLDFSTFNWVGLIFDLRPSPGVTHVWVFAVGLLLQISYLVLRYTVRFRYVRLELEGRGADLSDIDDITRGQVGYMGMLVLITAFFTSVIYLAIPYISEYTQDPLEGLPVPHMVAGLLVVVIIAFALIMYLRDA